MHLILVIKRKNRAQIWLENVNYYGYSLFVVGDGQVVVTALRSSLPDLRQARPQSRHHLPLSESFLQIGPYPHLVTACIITIILIVIQ